MPPDLSLKREDISEDSIAAAAILQGLYTNNSMYTVHHDHYNYRKKTIAAGKALKFQDCYEGKKGQLILIFNIEDDAVTFAKPGEVEVGGEIIVEIEYSKIETMMMGWGKLVRILSSGLSSKLNEDGEYSETNSADLELDELLGAESFGAFS